MASFKYSSNDDAVAEAPRGNDTQRLEPPEHSAFIAVDVYSTGQKFGHTFSLNSMGKCVQSLLLDPDRDVKLSQSKVKAALTHTGRQVEGDH